MKTLKTILIATVAVLLLNSCKKDKDGQRIQYYKQPTGEGYVFCRTSDNILIPYANAKISLENVVSHADWVVGNYIGHTDDFFTDEKGYYSCKFVKKINGMDVKEHVIYPPSIYNNPNNNPNNNPIDPNEYIPNGYECDFYSGVTGYPIVRVNSNIIKNSTKKYFLDTLFINIHIK